MSTEPAAAQDDVREITSSRVESTRLQLWLAKRLGILSAGDEPIELESQKLGFALRLIENVGLMSMFGFSKFAPGPAESVDERNGAMELGLEALASSGLESIVSASVASFKQTPGNGIVRRSLDGLGWFGDWLVDEDLPPSHPFAIRIAEALKIAWGSQIADPQASLVLAERLGVPVDIAIDMVSRHLERGQA